MSDPGILLINKILTFLFSFFPFWFSLSLSFIYSSLSLLKDIQILLGILKCFLQSMFLIYCLFFKEFLASYSFPHTASQICKLIFPSCSSLLSLLSSLLSPFRSYSSNLHTNLFLVFSSPSSQINKNKKRIPFQNPISFF